MVEVRPIDENKGNGLFATHRFKSGDTLFEEAPFVSSQFAWNRACKYLVCDYCFQPLETTDENICRLSGMKYFDIPHKECCTIDKSQITECVCGTSFCSSTCQEKANTQYHTVLCPYIKDDRSPLVKLEEFWKTIHYPPETSTIMLIPRLLAMILQAENKQEIRNNIMGFCHKSVNKLKNISHKFLQKPDQLSNLYQALRVSMPTTEGIEDFLTEDGFKALLSILATNGQGIASSPFSQWIKNVYKLPMTEDDKKKIDDFVDHVYAQTEAHTGNEFLDAEGIGLYMLQSKCNHSCEPNAEVRFEKNNNILSLVALKDIDMSEEICISYLDECDLSRSRHSRQKQLKENYLFICNCSMCISQSEDPDVTSDEEMEEDEFNDST